MSYSSATCMAGVVRIRRQPGFAWEDGWNYPQRVSMDVIHLKADQQNSVRFPVLVAGWFQEVLGSSVGVLGFRRFRCDGSVWCGSGDFAAGFELVLDGSGGSGGWLKSDRYLLAAVTLSYTTFAIGDTTSVYSSLPP